MVSFELLSNADPMALNLQEVTLVNKTGGVIPWSDMYVSCRQALRTGLTCLVDQRDACMA